MGQAKELVQRRWKIEDDKIVGAEKVVLDNTDEKKIIRNS